MYNYLLERDSLVEVRNVVFLLYSGCDDRCVWSSQYSSNHVDPSSTPAAVSAATAGSAVRPIDSRGSDATGCSFVTGGGARWRPPPRERSRSTWDRAGCRSTPRTGEPDALHVVVEIDCKHCKTVVWFSCMVLMIVVQSPIPTNLDCNIFTVPDIIVVVPNSVCVHWWGWGSVQLSYNYCSL